MFNKLMISAIVTLVLSNSSCISLISMNEPPSKIVKIDSLTWQEDKYLWVSQGNQTIRWDTQNQEAQTYKNKSGQLLVDSSGNLWVLGKDIAHYFDGQNWQSFKSGDDFVGGYVLSYVEADENIWLGTSGLSHYIPQSKSWEVLLEQVPESKPASTTQTSFAEGLLEGIHSISLDSQNNIWVGTNKGLTHITNDSAQTWDNVVLNTEGVRCLLIVDNKIWVCSSNGVGMWNGSEWHNFIKLPEPIYIVQGIANDIWVGTWESGVANWNGVSWNVWSYSDGLSGERITSFLVSKPEGNVWIGTKTGISRWNNEEWHIYDASKGLKSEYITVLYQSPNGTIWAGTLAGDIFYYEPDTDRWNSFP